MDVTKTADYQSETEILIANVVNSSRRDDIVDAKNALIAYVNDRANGNLRVRKTLMFDVEQRLGLAYL